MDTLPDSKNIDDCINRIFLQDAISLLAALPDSSIDMIFCDPPYGHNNNDGDLIQNWEKALGHQKRAGEGRAIANDGQEANDLFRSVLPEFKRLLKKGAVACCCCGGGGPDPQFARWSLWMDEILEFKQMVVWDKGKMGMGWHYRRSYETILVAQKQGAACFWFDESQKIENIIRPDMNIPKIIPQSNQHPTQKPEELAMHFIRLHTQKDMIVLDPFAGSGSTLLAAKQLGRRYIGCEIDSQFVEMARGRLGEDIAYKSKAYADGTIQRSLFE